MVAGRVFAFADAEIIRLAKTRFVPACADDWYQRRRSDATGEFWKKVYKQGPRKNESSTHQGIYIFTPMSWFRQLPAGVPGAYRMFANFLSAGKVAAR